MNIRPAPFSVMLGVKRRLEKSNPGAVLDEQSVKLVAIPQTQFDATIFIFSAADSPGRTGGAASTLARKHRLIAELCRPGLPHIFAGRIVDPEGKGGALALVWVVAQLGWRILNDPRFSSRGNVIELGDVSLRKAGTQELNGRRMR